MDETDELHLCDVVLVPDPAETIAGTCMSKERWVAAMRGAYLINVDIGQGNGPRGTAVKYKAALATKRQVFVPDAFRKNHVHAFNLIKACVAIGPCSGPCQWELIDKATLLHQKTHAMKSNAAVIGLGVTADRKHCDFNDIRHFC